MFGVHPLVWIGAAAAGLVLGVFVLGRQAGAAQAVQDAVSAGRGTQAGDETAGAITIAEPLGLPQLQALGLVQGNLDFSGSGTSDGSGGSGGTSSFTSGGDTGGSDTFSSPTQAQLAALAASESSFAAQPQPGGGFFQPLPTFQSAPAPPTAGGTLTTQAGTLKQSSPTGSGRGGV